MALSPAVGGIHQVGVLEIAVSFAIKQTEANTLNEQGVEQEGADSNNEIWVRQRQ